DGGVVDPGVQPPGNGLGVILLDRAGGEVVAGALNPLGEDVARRVLVGPAGVGYGQQRDVDRPELARLVDRHQGWPPERYTRPLPSPAAGKPGQALAASARRLAEPARAWRSYIQ